MRRRGIYPSTPLCVQARDSPYYRELRGTYRDFEVEYKQPTPLPEYTEEAAQRAKVTDWLHYTNGSCPPDDSQDRSSYSDYPRDATPSRRQLDTRYPAYRQGGQRGRFWTSGSVRYPQPGYDVLERIKEVYEQIETLTNELKWLKSIAPKRKKRHGYNYYKFNPEDW